MIARWVDRFFAWRYGSYRRSLLVQLERVRELERDIIDEIQRIDAVPRGAGSGREGA